MIDTIDMLECHLRKQKIAIYEVVTRQISGCPVVLYNQQVVVHGKLDFLAAGSEDGVFHF